MDNFLCLSVLNVWAAPSASGSADLAPSSLLERIRHQSSLRAKMEIRAARSLESKRPLRAVQELQVSRLPVNCQANAVTDRADRTPALPFTQPIVPG
jgi:hypothetical protein